MTIHNLSTDESLFVQALRWFASQPTPPALIRGRRIISLSSEKLIDLIYLESDFELLRDRSKEIKKQTFHGVPLERFTAPQLRKILAYVNNRTTFRDLYVDVLHEPGTYEAGFRHGKKHYEDKHSEAFEKLKEECKGKCRQEHTEGIREGEKNVGRKVNEAYQLGFKYAEIAKQKAWDASYERGKTDGKIDGEKRVSKAYNTGITHGRKLEQKESRSGTSTRPQSTFHALVLDEFSLFKSPNPIGKKDKPALAVGDKVRIHDHRSIIHGRTVTVKVVAGTSIAVDQTPFGRTFLPASWATKV